MINYLFSGGGEMSAVGGGQGPKVQYVNVASEGETKLVNEKPLGGALAQLKAINDLFATYNNDTSGGHSSLENHQVQMHSKILEGFENKVKGLTGLPALMAKVDEFVGCTLGIRSMSTIASVRHEAKRAEKSYQEVLGKSTTKDHNTIDEKKNVRKIGDLSKECGVLGGGDDSNKTIQLKTLVSQVNSCRTCFPAKYQSVGMSALEVLKQIKDSPTERRQFLDNIAKSGIKNTGDLVDLMRMTPLDNEIGDLLKDLPEVDKTSLERLNTIGEKHIKVSSVPGLMKAVDKASLSTKMPCTQIMDFLLGTQGINPKKVLKNLGDIVQEDVIHPKENMSVAKAYINYLNSNNPKFLEEVDGQGNNLLHLVAAGGNSNIANLLKECEGYDAALQVKNKEDQLPAVINSNIF